VAVGNDGQGYAAGNPALEPLARQFLGRLELLAAAGSTAPSPATETASLASFCASLNSAFMATACGLGSAGCSPGSARLAGAVGEQALGEDQVQVDLAVELMAR